MSRWILLIVIALVVSYLIDSQAKRLRRRVDDLRGAARPGNPTRSAQVHTVGELVACATCGVHVPKQRSLGEGSRRFCSEACRQRSATTRS
ncbi:MAG: hypothetical protein GY856_00610 [bacterium]|nr:hypothetical protein [bacterium]